MAEQYKGDYISDREIIQLADYEQLETVFRNLYNIYKYSVMYFLKEYGETVRRI